MYIITMLDTTPTVSIVIPCYNAASYIDDTLQSLFCQTYEDLNIIFVDDGSSDSTADTLSLYKNRITLIQVAHGGASKARNIGVTAAKGGLIAFMDADDVAHPNRIEKQVAVMESEPDTDLCHSNFCNFSQSNVTDLIANKCIGSLTPRYLCGTVMMRRKTWSQVGPFNEGLQIAEYIEWQLRAIRTGIRMRYIDEVLYFRRIHAGNNSKNVGLYGDYARVLRAYLHATDCF
jgi:glycosyltransferase involved in cell wall biosynthesis